MVFVITGMNLSNCLFLFCFLRNNFTHMFRFQFTLFIKELCCFSFHPMLNYVVLQIKNKTIQMMERKMENEKSFVLIDASRKENVFCLKIDLMQINESM